MIMKKNFLFLLIVLIPLGMSSQIKKTKTGVSKQNTNKATTTKKLHGFDIEYKGVVGDYLPFVVKFKPGSSAIDAEAAKCINDVAHYLKNHPNVNIVAAAYTQEDSDTRRSKELSNKRAYEVKSALVFNHNIDQLRIIGNGMGIDHGVVACFCNTSDAVVFFEQGFITHMELEKELSERFSGVEAALLSAMISLSSDSGDECSYCSGTGYYNGSLCPKCKGKKYDEDKVVYEGSKAGKKVTQAVKNMPKRKMNSNNFKNGYQIKVYNNGTYEGYLTNGLRNGRGVFIFDNGSRYSGEWKDDQITGWGMFRSIPAYDFDKNNKYKILSQRHAGYYKAGQLVSENRALFYPNGEIFLGTMSNGKMNTYGKRIMTDGNCYEGNWVKGKCNGKGKIYYKNGTIEQGVFKDGILTDKVNYVRTDRSKDLNSKTKSYDIGSKTMPNSLDNKSISNCASVKISTKNESVGFKISGTIRNLLLRKSPFNAGIEMTKKGIAQNGCVNSYGVILYFGKNGYSKAGKVVTDLQKACDYWKNKGTIVDLNMTDKDHYVIVAKAGGPDKPSSYKISFSGMSEEMLNGFTQTMTLESPQIQSYCFNEKGNWAIIAHGGATIYNNDIIEDFNFVADPKTMSLIYEAYKKYGKVLTVSMTDTGVIVCCENGVLLKDVPSPVYDELRSIKFKPYIIKFHDSGHFIITDGKNRCVTSL